MTDNEIVEKTSDGSIARVRFKAVSAVATPQAIEQMVVNYAAAIETYGKQPCCVHSSAAVRLQTACINPMTPRITLIRGVCTQAKGNPEQRRHGQNTRDGLTKEPEMLFCRLGRRNPRAVAQYPEKCSIFCLQ